MRKLTLDLDTLRVDSFAAETGGGDARGTVHGLRAAVTDKTPFVTETIPYTYCGNSCDCGGTGDASCRSCGGGQTCGSCLAEFCEAAVEEAAHLHAF